MPEPEPAQTKVLATPELLEIILLQLDIRTLLVSAPRVCLTWSLLIQSSPAIQQALFFQKEDTKPDHGGINGYIYNPLLVQAFRPFFPPSAHEFPPRHDNAEKATETEPKYEGSEEENETSFSFKPLDMLSSPRKKTAYMRKEASWRRMLLCQPPVYGAVTVFKMYQRMGDSYKCYQVPNPMGDDGDILKMGHFFTTLTQNRDLFFGRHGQMRVYWSAYVPPCKSDSSSRGSGMDPPQGMVSSDPAVEKAFADAIEESEVVLFSTEMLLCSVTYERRWTDEDSLRKEIVEAERESEK